MKKDGSLKWCQKIALLTTLGCSNESYVRSLIQSAIFYVKKVIKKKGMNDLEVKTLWLSNMIRLLNNLKQYSGEKQFQQDCTTKQIDQCLRNFDLSEFRRVLMDVAVWIYQASKISYVTLLILL